MSRQSLTRRLKMDNELEEVMALFQIIAIALLIGVMWTVFN